MRTIYKVAYLSHTLKLSPWVSIRKYCKVAGASLALFPPKGKDTGVTMCTLAIGGVSLG